MGELILTLTLDTIAFDEVVKAMRIAGYEIGGLMSDLIEKARRFAAAAHGAIGQKRKYTGEPYGARANAQVQSYLARAHGADHRAYMRSYMARRRKAAMASSGSPALA